MDIKSITRDQIALIETKELSSLHSHLHRIFSVSGEKAQVAIAHDLIANELVARGESHTTPIAYSPTGLYLKSPHGRLVFDGKKTSIAQNSLVGIEGQHVLISKENGVGLAFGLVTIALPVTIDSEEFDSLFNSHRVTSKERLKWWAESPQLYLYNIKDFTPYEKPKHVDVPPGVQMLIQEVKFIESDGDNGNSGEEVKFIESDDKSDEEEIMPWKASDAQSHTKLADTPKKQSQWAEVANSARKRCMDDGGSEAECDASAIRQANSVVKKDSKELEGENDIVASICEMVKQRVIDELIDEFKLESIEEIESEPESTTPEPEIKETTETNTDSAEVAQPETQEKDIPETIPNTEKDTAQVQPSVPQDVPPDVPTDHWPPRQRIHRSMIDRLKDALSTLGDIIGLTDTSAPSSIMLNSLPMVFKSKDGIKTYFIIWPTNSYRDREDELFKIKSLHDFVDRMDSESIKSVAEFWHLSQTKFGNIIWQDVVSDRFMPQIGVFDDTPVGNAFKEFFSKYPDGHPVIAPEGWGASHGYHYDSVDRQDKEYDWLHDNESSVLPMRYAANVFNPSPMVLGGKEMNDKRKEALDTISQEVGFDLASLVQATADAAKNQLDGVVEHKAKKPLVDEKKPEDETEETEEKKPDEKPKEKSSDTSGEVPVKTDAAVESTPEVHEQGELVEAITKSVMENLGLKELASVFEANQATLKGLVERIDKLEGSDEEKLAEKVMGGFPNLPWVRASQAQDTLLGNSKQDSDLKDKKPHTLGGSPIAEWVSKF